MSYVVEGSEGRSGGLLSCFVAQQPGTHDEARANMMRNLHPERPRVRWPKWDFVCQRADGSHVRLHPARGEPKFDAYEVKNGTEPPAVPPPPKGQTGYFQFVKKSQRTCQLKFDSNKGRGC